MSRSTVQRATLVPPRLRAAQTLSAPYTPRLSACTLAMSTLSASSRRALADGGRFLAQ